ncbi:MAG: ornithine cyclodeaminase family protein [Lachnospiraceae bacterium]|nr:ornithine cyclodeaminase family protein [Lachnospiraceae bacterium]
MKIGKEVLYLTRSEVQKTGLTMKEYIDLMEEAHRDKGNKAILMPPKLTLQPNENLFMLGMGCVVERTGAAGIKWLSGCATNRDKGLPRFTGFVILNDLETGAPVCIMDATYLTAMRTAAVSGLALRYLANKDSRVVGVYGCGMEGRTNLEAAICECPEICQVYAWAPRRASVERYIEEMREKFPHVRIEASEDPKQVMREADIFLGSSPVTHGDEFKLVRADWLKPGLTAVPVNTESHFYDEAVEQFHKIYIDDTAMYELCREKGHYKTLKETPPELSELLTGGTAGREGKEQKIITFTEGVGLNDVACGEKIFRLALEMGIGTMLPLE